MKKILLAIGVIFLCVLIWGVGIEPRLIDEKVEEARIPSLPAAWEGKKVGLIADLQVGMWLSNRDTIRRVIRLLVNEKPAAVLIAGDLIYHPSEDDSALEARQEYDQDEQREAAELIDEAVELLQPLILAGIPTFAVLGNHDYAMETDSARSFPEIAEALTRKLKSAGIVVLQNETRALDGGAPSGQKLQIIGVGPHYPHADDVEKVLRQLQKDQPRIVLMHNPQSFLKFPAGSAPVALAAHTHGGQVRIPFLPEWSWLGIVKSHEVHADGWIKDFGSPGNSLYVNRGIGFSGLPIRINCRPEITYFVLKRASAR